MIPLLIRRYIYHGSVPRVPPPQTLLIDADDTLWENNIYFERAIADFISFLNHRERTPEEVRQILNDVERDCIVSHGYTEEFRSGTGEDIHANFGGTDYPGTSPDNSWIRAHDCEATDTAFGWG